jgi:hypothetical protein
LFKFGGESFRRQRETQPNPRKMADFLKWFSSWRAKPEADRIPAAAKALLSAMQ